MSNYRTGYFIAETFPGGRPLTPKQRRRLAKKVHRDTVYGLAASGGVEIAVRPGNPNPPASLSGHPGRRRAQLAERAAVAEEREIARALRKQAAVAKRRPSGASIAHALFGSTR